MIKKIVIKTISIISLIWIFAPPSLIAQIKPGNLVQFTEQDGLPGAQANHILQDQSGYMWIGTINGLARFDGYEFRRFYPNPNDSASMQGMIVWSLFEDHTGQIWIGASPEFLNAYNPVTKAFRQYEFKSLIPHPANVEIGIAAMAEDHRGRIYLGVTSDYYTLSQGLLYYDQQDDRIKKFSPPDSLATQNVYRIVTDSKNTVWLLSWNGSYHIGTDNKLTKLHFWDPQYEKNREYFTDIKCDKEGHVWFITSNARLVEYFPETNKYKIFSPGDLMKTTNEKGDKNTLIFDKDENIWIGTNPGLRYFDQKTSIFEIYDSATNKSFSQASVVDLQFDSFGSLWMGTALNDIFKYEEKTVLKSYSSVKDDAATITPGWANHILECSDGKILITTSGQGNASGFNTLDPATGILTPLPFKLVGNQFNHIFGIFENAPDQFFLSTSGGQFQFSLKTKTLRKIAMVGIPDSLFIHQYLRDSHENLWICTNSGLFKKTKGSAEFKKYDLNQVAGGNMISNEIDRAFESSRHGLWLMTPNGLFLYDYKTDKIERHGFDKKAGDVFMTQTINSFYEDSTGTVWVGLWQGGLSRYDVENKKITTYTRSDGLPSMSIQGILPDPENNALWLSTFEGLSRFDLNSGHFNNYTIADGAQSQLFADNSNLKTSKGLFLFGGANGINVFNAKDVNKNSIPPRVLLTDLKLFNQTIIPGENSILKKPINETKEIILRHDQNNISIEFLAIHYSNPAKNRSAYKLENYENEWRDAGNQHVAFYPMLHPGKYIFHVKAANNNGVWNEEGATLKITIKPPWWRTLWAYILYLILFALAAFVSDRYFRSRLLRREREKSRLRDLEQAKEIEKAYHKLEQSHERLKATQSQLIQAEKMATLGELTAGVAHEIQNPLNFVTNFSELSIELIDEMIEDINKGNVSELESLSDNLKQNLEKISQHGKRADAIVKGMLQHSRTASGVREPTDINSLTEEFMRLSYFGMKAKDKSFQADMKTDFDPSIGKINIIPQDIGRVILNLFSNAFYAVHDKSSTLSGSDHSDESEKYQPVVSASTRKNGAGVEIRIRDNGPGISEKVLDKIFQPFFTTKPTGEGTGLGLSLSYDIVTKGHGGKLTVETREGEFTEFIIHLPASIQ